MQLLWGVLVVPPRHTSFCLGNVRVGSLDESIGIAHYAAQVGSDFVRTLERKCRAVEDKAEQEEVDFVYSVSKLVFIEHLRIGLEQARQSFAVLVKKFRDALALRGPLERFVCDLRFVDSRHYAIALDSKLMVLIKRPTPRFGLTPNTLRNLYYGRLMQMLRAEGRDAAKVERSLATFRGIPYIPEAKARMSRWYYKDSPKELHTALLWEIEQATLDPDKVKSAAKKALEEIKKPRRPPPPCCWRRH